MKCLTSLCTCWSVSWIHTDKVDQPFSSAKSTCCRHCYAHNETCSLTATVCCQHHVHVDNLCGWSSTTCYVHNSWPINPRLQVSVFITAGGAWVWVVQRAQISGDIRYWRFGRCIFDPRTFSMALRKLIDSYWCLTSSNWSVPTYQQQQPLYTHHWMSQPHGRCMHTGHRMWKATGRDDICGVWHGEMTHKEAVTPTISAR